MVNPMGFFRFTVGNSWSDTPSLSNSIHNCYISKTNVGLAPHVRTSITA